MCYRCVFENEINARELIKKEEKDDLENSRVNANIVKKCLYLQNRYAEYKRLAHAKDELEKKDIVYDCDEYNTVDDSDDHDDDDEKPAYKIKTKKDSPQGESAL